MLGKTDVNLLSHVKPGDTPWRLDGLRDFFLYRDLGRGKCDRRAGDCAIGEGQPGPAA